MKEVKKLDTNIKTVSFSDLYSMYNFVNGMNIKNFNPAMKSIVKNKTIELENEIYMRLFNLNPFKDNTENKVAEVKGKDPIKVLQSLDTNDKTFVVAPSDVESDK